MYSIALHCALCSATSLHHRPIDVVLSKEGGGSLLREQQLYGNATERETAQHKIGMANQYGNVVWLGSRCADSCPYEKPPQMRVVLSNPLSQRIWPLGSVETPV